MVSGGKEENIEIRLYNLNKNLKSSFSAVKKDINNLTKKKDHLVSDINNQLSETRKCFVKNQDFQSEIDSLNEKHNRILKEVKKREKLKKELREALKLKESVDLMIEGFKKANGIKKKFENLKNIVVDVNEFNMQTNKFDARIKKRAQDISSIKKELDEFEKRFIDKSYFNKQLSEVRQEILSVRKNSVENNYFKRNLNRLDSRFRKIINFLKKHPEIRKEDKKKINEVEKVQGKEEGTLKSAWNGIVDFFTEEVGESEEGKPKKIKKKDIEKKKKPKKKKKHEILKRIWNAVVDFFTEDESEKRGKPKKKEGKPKKIKKKSNKKNKLIKLATITAGVIILFFIYYLGFFERIIAFIISYKYNILLGIIILVIIIFLSERKKEK